MILLNSRPLVQATLDHLADKQTDVDGKLTFLEKKKRATTLWNGKKGSNPGEAAFLEIFERLIEMAIGVETCNYCENNEGIDVEHIFPKSAYPEKAFIWDNYLLACKKCNTHYKLDKFAVVHPANPITRFDIERGTEPPNDHALLINPRTEDGMDFLWLDIEGKTFRFSSIESDANTIAHQKAKYTLELLALNERDALHTARGKAAKYYFSRLKMYVEVSAATDFSDIEDVIDPFTIEINLTGNFTEEKNKIKEAIKLDILEYPHTTVWKELIRQRANLRRTNELFLAAPEALEWKKGD